MRLRHLIKSITVNNQIKLQSTSDMQYHCNINYSTAMCTVSLKEGINAYCYLFDASKAFNKINYCNVFSSSLQRSINVYCVQVIVDRLVLQSSRVSCGNHLSQYVKLLNELNKVEYFL